MGDTKTKKIYFMSLRILNQEISITATNQFNEYTYVMLCKTAISIKAFLVVCRKSLRQKVGLTLDHL